MRDLTPDFVAVATERDALRKATRIELARQALTTPSLDAGAALEVLRDSLLEARLIQEASAKDFVSTVRWARNAAAEHALCVTLHTTDPDLAEYWLETEATYAGYERQRVRRDPEAWKVSMGSAMNVDAIDFPECRSGSQIITHFGIVLDGVLIVSGALVARLVLSRDVRPCFPPEQLGISFDDLSDHDLLATRAGLSLVADSCFGMKR